MLNEIKEEISGLILDVVRTKISREEILASIEPGKVGDLSSRISFMLAKEKKENPAKIASEIAGAIAVKIKKNGANDKINKPDKTDKADKTGKADKTNKVEEANPNLVANLISKASNFDKVEAAGPYINFYLSDHAYAEILADVLLKKEKYGMGKKKGGKVILEFPSVNPNKPWHIGHLRNALLGDSIGRIMEFDGYNVERVDYIDDLGLQVAQSLWGFLNFDSNPDPNSKFDSWLGHQYVGIAKRFEEDKVVVGGVREVLKSMEEGKNEIATAGRDLAEKCTRAQYQTAFDLSIYHDVLIFESDILRTIFQEGIEYIKKNDAVVLESEGKNAGCWVVKLSSDFEKEFGKMENPDKVLLRSDGTAVYTGKDVIFHLWKFGKLQNEFRYAPFIKQPNGKTAYMSSSKPEGEPLDFGRATSVINVIGVEQKYPQRVIVEVLKRLNFTRESENLHHLSYEHVGLPDEKFSGRKGTWVGYTADDLIEEARTRVMEKIKLDVGEKEKQTIAKMVGVAAIKFSFLRTSSDKRITFKWEDALNMDGDSGPYLQYAFVRTNGIFSKTSEKPAVSVTSLNEQERNLIKRLCQFYDIVSRASRERAPHHIAQYALDLAGDFSSFYTTSSVLNAGDSDIMKNRLAITLATSIVLRNALSLIGIECPERM